MTFHLWFCYHIGFMSFVIAPCTGYVLLCKWFSNFGFFSINNAHWTGSMCKACMTRKSDFIHNGESIIILDLGRDYTEENVPICLTEQSLINVYKQQVCILWKKQLADAGHWLFMLRCLSKQKSPAPTLITWSLALWRSCPPPTFFLPLPFS